MYTLEYRNIQHCTVSYNTSCSGDCKLKVRLNTCTDKYIDVFLDLSINTGVIPISLFSLATGTVLRKAAIDRGVRLATGRYGCRQINKPSNSTVSVLI